MKILNQLFLATLAALLVISCNQNNKQDDVTKFSDFVGDLWLNGRLEEANWIAKNRLQKNPDDLASMLVKLEYELAFFKTNELQKTLSHSLKVSKNLNSPNFQKVKSLSVARLNIFLDITPKITSERIQEDLPKAYITNKELAPLILIKALEADGLVKPITKEEKQVPNLTDVRLLRPAPYLVTTNTTSKSK